MYRSLLLLPLLLLPLLLSTAAHAELRFGAPLTDGDWQLESSRLMCRLSRDVPGLGSAAFIRVAGTAETAFELDLGAHPSAEGRVQLYTVPPPWDHRREPRDLTQLPVSGARLRLDGALSTRLLSALGQGLAPAVGYRDTDGERIEALISPVNISEALGHFQACATRLLPNGFDRLRHTRIDFAAGSAEVTPAARLALDRLAEYLLADRSVRRAVIDAGGDQGAASEEENRALAEQRAGAVREALTAHGVETPFELRSHLPAKPAKSAKSGIGKPPPRTVAGRVEITLIR